MQNPILKIENLTKCFKDFIAVNDIAFEVESGEIFALLGPNGAGKTTTIKIFITLLKPTKGKGYIDQYEISRQPSEIRKIIGYVPQMISVDGSLTAEENLMLMARLYDIPRGERKKRIEETFAFLQLQEYRNTLVRKFSGGMIRKLEIGQAILHRPQILFLDEPTSGLDPIARKNVWKHLMDLKNQFGTTIFFTTHYMDEAEESCDRVAIMNQGKIAAIGTPKDLKAKVHQQGATLEDVFIFFTGAKLQESGNFHEIRRARQIEKRLG